MGNDSGDARPGGDRSGEGGLVCVDVAYSPAPRTVDLASVRVAPGSSVLQAVQSSGVLERHAALTLDAAAVGIWGRPAAWSDAVQSGDRIEIYRPLRVDPKEARRQRYRAQGERGRRRPGSRA